MAAKKETRSKTVKPKLKAAQVIRGKCLCGAVEIETDVPVFWAWHDHSAPSRIAHGSAYATYVGTYRSKVRINRGEDSIRRFAEEGTGDVRSFCGKCGAPVSYERKRSPKWVNLPRALFSGRTGREAKYHVAHDQLQDWAYLGAPVSPVKNYPGLMMERVRKKKAKAEDSLFDAEMFGPPDR
jgi:hypothetical protein